jgi:hypothetical protein
MSWHVTGHAAQRGMERFGHRNRSEARLRIAHACRSSMCIPRRLEIRLLGRAHRRQDKGGVRFRVDGAMCLVVRGHSVITVWPLTGDALIEVTWWALSRH